VAVVSQPLRCAPKAAPSINTVLTKSAAVAHLSDAAQVAGKDVCALLVALEETIRVSISRKGPRTFTLPGLLKITVTSVPAKKARKGINPFTGQDTGFTTRPATVKVKVQPMKKL
jgi:hypothetical protein